MSQLLDKLTLHFEHTFKIDIRVISRSEPLCHYLICVTYVQVRPLSC